MQNYNINYPNKRVWRRGNTHLWKSERLKQHIITIGVDQSLSNSAIYEHKCMENMKELYKPAGKCDNQQQYKAII